VLLASCKTSAEISISHRLIVTVSQHSKQNIEKFNNNVPALLVTIHSSIIMCLITYYTGRFNRNTSSINKYYRKAQIMHTWRRRKNTMHSIMKEKTLAINKNLKGTNSRCIAVNLSVSQPQLLHQMLKSMSVLKSLPEHGNELICLHGEHLPNKCDVHISHWSTQELWTCHG
jgi:hypothetical protein